ncbi:MAG: exo-beta-N-acetylmuramidase NamZ domain-containing protein [Pyrinomonadaceae bacterium]
MSLINTYQNRANVKIGIEKLLEEEFDLIAGKSVGLICNQASVNHHFQYSADLLHENPAVDLTVLFGPQHGIRGDVQDNMIETGHSVDSVTGIEVYSLYSETRIPTEEMMADVDAVIFDLQDIGGRVYTFVYTMANAMIACKKFGKKMIVCDRPNPINGSDVEGSLLVPGHESFVGMFPIPMRHGMTAGELAKLFNNEFGIGCDLEVVEMDGWSRDLYLDETDTPWVMPSPNMPTVDTAVVFPGTVYFEGTQVSEGRGTTRPFELIGAPYINAETYAQTLELLDLPGVIFRPVNFLPTFQKHAGTVCGGVFVHVIERENYEPVITGVAMVKTAFDLYPEDFKWKQPPYEYEYDRNPFDVIAGTTDLREAFEKGMSIEEIRLSWQNDTETFLETRAPYLIYKGA